MLVLDRRCERLLRRGRSTPIRHSNVPSDRQLRASSGSDALSRHRSSLQRAQPIATHHHRLRGQIAIERAAPSVPHLPRLRALQVCRRRPLVCVAASVMAGIRKPLAFDESRPSLKFGTARDYAKRYERSTHVDSKKEGSQAQKRAPRVVTHEAAGPAKVQKVPTLGRLEVGGLAPVRRPVAGADGGVAQERSVQAGPACHPD
jgi:hypothetical protein